MPFCLSTQILNGWDKSWLGGLQRHHVSDSNGLQTSSFRQQTPNYQQHLPSCWIVKGELSFIIFHFSVDGHWYGSACCDWTHWYPTSSINKMPPCMTRGVRARILLHLCNPAKFGHVWGGLQTLWTCLHHEEIQQAGQAGEKGWWEPCGVQHSKYPVLHLGWDNPMQQYSLGTNCCCNYGSEIFFFGNNQNFTGQGLSNLSLLWGWPSCKQKSDQLSSNKNISGNSTFDLPKSSKHGRSLLSEALSC